MDTVIKTTDLTKVYRNCMALDHLSIELHRGHIYGLIGNNGAGKSTLFQILAGLVKPTSGNYSIFASTSDKENRIQRKRIGFLFTTHGLSESMSASQNLIALQKLKGYTDQAEVLSLLHEVGIEGSKAERERIRTFSTGQRQRVTIAAALLGCPELLVLDEPLIGLDPEAIKTVNDLLLRQVQEHNTTILISSHNLPQLYNLATDFIFLDHGKCLEMIDHETLYKRRTYSVTILAQPSAQAKCILNKAFPELSSRIIGDDEIILDDCTVPTEKLLSALARNGITVKSISAEGSSLEDYFLSVIGGLG